MANEILSDYMNFMSDLENAIQRALYTTVRDGLIASINDSAFKNVYSYPAKEYFAEKRRYMIADSSNFSAANSYGTTLVLENTTSLQRGDPGEVNIVEEGMKSWNQPKPREFMEPGLQSYVNSGQAERDLMWSLAEQGFAMKLF